MIDLGGVSTEFVWIDGIEIFFFISVDLGVVWLIDLYLVGREDIVEVEVMVRIVYRVVVV